MSPQLALSSLFSIFALASLCLSAAAGGVLSDSSRGAAPAYSVQAEIVPGLNT